MGRVKLSAVALLLALVACEDGPPPGAGLLTVTIESPNAAEGAARLVLVGPGMVRTVEIDGPVATRVRGDTMSVLVMRPDPGVLRFGLEVADTTRKPTGTLVQVAGPDNRLRSALAGYGVEVRR